MIPSRSPELIVLCKQIELLGTLSFRRLYRTVFSLDKLTNHGKVNIPPGSRDFELFFDLYNSGQFTVGSCPYRPLTRGDPVNLRI